MYTLFQILETHRARKGFQEPLLQKPLQWFPTECAEPNISMGFLTIRCLNQYGGCDTLPLPQAIAPYKKTAEALLVA